MNIKTTSLVILSLLSTSFTLAQQSKPITVEVNPDRIERRIFELAEFGKNDKGENYRVAYSDGDIAGRAYFMDLMKKAGLEVRVDAAGNIIGKREGTDPNLKPIAFGSHIDMVPNGGNYDGAYGSITALEIIEVLNENNINTRHPLEVLIFQNEEGGLVGSRAMTGNLKKEALEQLSASGLSIREGIQKIGGLPDRLNEAVRMPGDLAAFLEIHIEQSKVLESRGIDLAIVEGIVGIEDWDIVVQGMANHAGSTPMNDRQDALIAASKLVLAVNEVVNSYDGFQVGSVGKMKVEPGAPNVIPGRVEMSLQMRDLSTDKIMRMFADIEQKAKNIELETGTSINFIHSNLSNAPSLASREIQDKMIQAAESMGISYMKMQSGAGHDVQEMSSLAPIGLVFIPSKDGISHNPQEFSTKEDMAKGANVMLRTVLMLDQEKPVNRLK